MPDETPIIPLHIVQHLVFVVKTWPLRTMFSADFLAAPHTKGATLQGDTTTGEQIVFTTFNGGATYHLEPQTEPGGFRIGNLVEGSDKATSRRVMLERD